ncbi:MAG: hypothetical protein JNL39_22335 [Opitutaceae bacterium]|nr:hypothetical protein [Opitutaceae bacterium]
MREHPELGRARVLHRLAWLWEPLEPDPRFELRTMFGAKAAYLDGQLALCFCAGEEPWRGLLVCTDRGRHAALVAEFPELRPHTVLPKWLYLPESAETFERSATLIVSLARHRDPRIGVAPQAKRKRAAPKPGAKKPKPSRRSRGERPK